MKSTKIKDIRGQRPENGVTSATIWFPRFVGEERGLLSRTAAGNRACDLMILVQRTFTSHGNLIVNQASRAYKEENQASRYNVLSGRRHVAY